MPSDGGSIPPTSTNRKAGIHWIPAFFVAPDRGAGAGKEGPPWRPLPLPGRSGPDLSGRNSVLRRGQPRIGTRVISTRRFWARPASVSLLAIGRLSPAPTTIILSRITPRLPR